MDAFERDAAPRLPASRRASPPPAQFATVNGRDSGTPLRRPSAINEENQRARAQLQVVHDELERLGARRQELEERRRQLLAATIPPRQRGSRFSSVNSSARDKPLPRARRTTSPFAQPYSAYMYSTTSSRIHEGSATNSGAVSERAGRRGRVGGSSHTPSVLGLRSYGGADSSRAHSVGFNEEMAEPIPSEQARRRAQPQTPYRAMKSALREAAQADSTLLMGDFLLEDNAKVYTFGRERRFIPVVGEKGAYYLGTDIALAQESVRAAAGRGSRLQQRGDSPGPGSYTPRYSKVSKPSPLTYMRW